MRGFGRIFKRKGSKYWWVGYNHRSKEYRESSKSIIKEDAKRLLQARLEQFKGFPFLSLSHTVEECFQEYFEDAERRGVKAINILRTRADRVVELIGDVRLVDVSTGTIANVQREVLRRGYGPSTVNMTIRCLSAALRQAARNGRLAAVPTMPRRLREPPPRSGFLERPAFEAIRRELTEPVRSIFSFAYHSGWRRTEILKLRWSEVDDTAAFIELSAERSKNFERRKLPIRGAIAEIVAKRRACRALGSDWVFNDRGRRIWESRLNREFRDAAKRAGYPETLFHDCRRTTVRDLIRAGVPEAIAMQLTGHRSRDVFQRYNITDERDLERAADARMKYFEAAEASGPAPADVVPFTPRMVDDELEPARGGL